MSKNSLLGRIDSDPEFPEINENAENSDDEELICTIDNIYKEKRESFRSKHEYLLEVRKKPFL